MITRQRRWVMTLGALAAVTLVATGCGGGALNPGGGDSGGESGSSAGIDTTDCPTGFDEIGITDDTVKIGHTSPLSGPAAIPLAIGLEAFVDMTNSQGGFEFGDGKTREVELVVLDDARETSRTRSNVEQLIHQDEVFALAGVSGTASNLAVRPIVAENCIPSLYMDSGNNEMGNPDFPWSIAPILPANAVDAKVAAELIGQSNPEAKVAILHQNDDLGKAMMSIFEETIEGTDITIASEASFEPTDTAVSGQITTLANSGATDFLMFSGNGTFQLQALESIAQSGWKPEIKYLTFFRAFQLEQVSPEAAEAVHFATWVSDPNDPEVVASNEEIQTFLEWYEKQPDASSFDPTIAQFGWMAGVFLAENFKEMETPTRSALIEAARTLTWDEESLYFDGITYSIDWPEYPFGIEALAVMTYDPESETLFRFTETVDMSGTIQSVKLN